jgi:hypothetical protein
MSNEMYGKVVHITPEMARDLLTRNHAGRRLNKSHVRELAQESVEGRWLLTHQGIALDGPDWSSHVLDGQHRLEMIATTDKDQDLFVVFNTPSGAFPAMDLALRRTGAQTAEMELAAHGKKTENPASRLASQARIILLHGSGMRKPSNAAVSHFVRVNADILDRYAPLAKAYTAGTAAAFSFAEISGFHGVRQAAQRLLEQLWEDEQKRDPMRALSRALVSILGQGDKAQRVRFFTTLAALEYVDRGEGLDIAKKYDAIPKRVSSSIEAHSIPAGAADGQ